MKRRVSIQAMVFAAVCMMSLGAGEVALVRDGVPLAAIVIGKNAPRPVSFGAAELSAYLSKIASCQALSVVHAPLPGRNRIVVGTVQDGESLRDAGIAAGELKEDGFALVARGGTVHVIGQNPRGALYGCYEILKKYGGVRWLTPGEDGEYFTPRRSISVPEQRTVVNPRYRYRLIQCDSEPNGCLWLVRNNLFGNISPGRIWDASGHRTKDADFYEGLALNIDATAGNSHILGNMMWGWGRDSGAVREKLFREHPEYFPLINGRRDRDAYANPCVSSPGLIDLMAENLYEHIKGSYSPRAYVTIGNNDTTVWCQCDECRKLDTASLMGTKGARSDRYWYLVGEIAKRIWARDPKIRLGGWGYQDFWYPPVKVKVDPRLRVIISYNNQCWRHSAQDTACSVNSEFCRIVEAWRKTGHPFLVNREEIYCESVGDNFLPAERVTFRNIDEQYEKMGFGGNYLCVHSPFPEFKAYFKNTPPYFGRNLSWYAMWQTCYLSAQAMWRRGVDFDAVYDEINRLYYGAAWEGGYREFRELQTEFFMGTQMCFGWSHHAPLGRYLNAVGAEERLTALMDKAVAAAKAGGDARALAHIQMAQQIYGLTWQKARKKYMENFQELKVYKRTAPIRIDGVLDEADWLSADALNKFTPGGMTPHDAVIQQSSVRACYDLDHLYVAVECLEPTPEKLWAGGSIRRDGTSRWDELGNHVEVFYNYPDMGASYYHLAINSKGQIWDALQKNMAVRDNSFLTKAQFAVKTLKDRWVVELAIPASEIGMNLYDGASWKLNVGRSRVLEKDGGELYRETSSCCGGAFHVADNFANIIFVPERADARGGKASQPCWQNASFDSAVKDSDIRGQFMRWSNAKNWTFAEPERLTARHWYINPGTTGTYALHEGSQTNRFVHLAGGGYLAQYFISDAPGKLRAHFRARGTGKLVLWTCCFKIRPDGQGFTALPGTTRSHVVALTPEWTAYAFEREKTGTPTEHVAFRFSPGKDSSVDLDDASVYLIAAEPADTGAGK